MRKATIRTIAEACGLSTATVDRVLNSRPGVSAAARHRVLSCARTLGYLPEEGAVPLPAHPVHLEFLLPIGTNAFLQALAAQITAFSRSLPLVASCRIHPMEGLAPGHLLAAAENLSPETRAVGVVATDHPVIREALKDLVEAGTRVVTIASDIPSIPRAAYVGVDNVAAGRVGGLLMGRLMAGSGRVCVFLGSRRYRGHEERSLGFSSILDEDFPDLRIVHAHEVFDARSASRDLARRVLAETPDLAGIYCVGGGRSGIAEALREAGRQREVVFVCHDYITEIRAALLDGTIDAVIDQNVRLLAEQAVIALLGSVATAVPSLTRKFIEPRIIFRENIPTLSGRPAPP